MQVEIIQNFAQYMETEPWYKFAFMDFVALYWSVLAKEANIVREKHGTRKAFFSMAFLTDMIPGVAMGFFFAQMQVLALPLKGYMGSGTYDEDEIVEQLVLKTGFDEPDWDTIDSRIDQIVQIVPRLFTAVVPTFKPMTEILLKLAEVPDLAVLQISNQSQVQVRVKVRDELQLRALKAKSGCEVMFEYQFPATDATTEKQISLCVDVPCLLDVIRACWAEGIQINQIYDFWC